MKSGSVADLVLYLLENFDPTANVEVLELIVDVNAKVRVYKPSCDEKPSHEKKVNKEVFTVTELDDPDEVNVGDLVYFDYTNAGNGPVTRVGFVVSDNYGSLLLYDLTVDGLRRFDHDFMEDIFLLKQ
jgi:hypothetical protein